MTDIKNEDTGDKKSLNFIEQAVEKDLKEVKTASRKCSLTAKTKTTT